MVNSIADRTTVVNARCPDRQHSDSTIVVNVGFFLCFCFFHFFQKKKNLNSHFSKTKGKSNLQLQNRHLFNRSMWNATCSSANSNSKTSSSFSSSFGWLCWPFSSELCCFWANGDFWFCFLFYFLFFVLFFVLFFCFFFVFFYLIFFKRPTSCPLSISFPASKIFPRDSGEIWFSPSPLLLFSPLLSSSLLFSSFLFILFSTKKFFCVGWVECLKK